MKRFPAMRLILGVSLTVIGGILGFHAGADESAISNQPQRKAKLTLAGLRSVDVMKYTKDVMAHQLSDEQIDNLVVTLKTLNINCIALSIPMDSSADYPANNKPSPRDAYVLTGKWADTVHQHGLHVIWRGTWSGIEGISGFARRVGANRFPAGTAASAATDGSSTWLGKTYQYIVGHPEFFVPGDVWAPLPERTENIFQDGTSFLPYSRDGINVTYTNFFNDLKTVSETAFAKIGKAVITGMTTNNYTEVKSGWLPQSFFEAQGITVIDYYGDNHTPEEMDKDIRQMYAMHKKPLFLQEWSDYWNGGLSEADRTDYLKRIYAVMQKLIDDGVLVGFNYWGGWSDTAESVLTQDGSGFHLNYRGRILQNFFKVNPRSRHE